MNTDNTESTGEFATGRAWLLFDAECALCLRWTRRFDPLLRRCRVEPRPLQMPGVAGRFGLSRDDLLKEMRFVNEAGQVFGGAEALGQIARRIWWAWPLFAWSRLPGIRRGLASGYRWIAARRGCAAGACHRRRTRTSAGWLPLLLLPSIALAFKGALPEWGFMWAMALALFVGCKWLTWWNAPNRAGQAGLRRTPGYFLAWPGMDAEAFLQHETQAVTRARETRKHNPGMSVWYFAAVKTLFGAGLIWGLAGRFLNESPLLAGWVGLAGCAFLLHFGLFHLLALIWQRLGVNAEPIMRAPILATSLGAFWGKRWNAAFHRLAHDYAFAALRRIVGPGTGTVVVFLLSGLVHEAVISLPANGGYGLPTAYFLVQGSALLFERSKLGRRLGLGRGLCGWLFTLVCVGGPAFALFHPTFIKAVILPFLGALGAF